MAGLYSYYLAPLVLTPAQVNIPQLVNTGNRLGGWIIVQNNSPYKIQVQLPGSGNTLPLDPQTVDKFVVNTGDQVIYILPLTLLPNAAPSSQLDIQVYPGPDPDNEPPGQYPMALSRQAAPTSSAQAGFTFSFTAGSSTSGELAIAVFNPANSGVNAIFHEGTFVDLNASDGTGQGALGWNTGDPALGNSFIPTSNDSNRPASKMMCEWSSSSTFSPTTQIDLARTTVKEPYNFIPFPDQKILRPGAAIVLTSLGGVTGFTSNCKFKWIEQ